MEVSRRHPGTLLASDDSPRVREGQFAFRRWAESPEYQDISQDHRAGADAVVLAKGLQ